MKKVVTGVFLLLTVAGTALGSSEEFVIDKEVTGVNKEVLENTNHNNAKLKVDNKDIIIRSSEISNENLKNQKQVITVQENKDDLQGSLKDTGTPIWKYILGAVALVVLGVSL
ncbi:hypothetical protein SAMN02745174_00214 [Cetobacterium ceti]|uniref:Uncharacterized protein n=1 Tax=Cetobacterium ceti TaxID=180163 RepID=A0A1T4K016_9FUSO|nr:hypothetical protein [Cetobacterium ceti]SJZ35724.1 hypothetical protein SAMN02745174_00214 [Cetobacterium ceti]